MSEARAVQYAEKILSVHEVYDQARAAQKDLKEAQRAEVEWATTKRTLIEAMNDRTAVFTNGERGRLHELSATAFEQHMKTALQLDDALKALRHKYIEAQSEHDAAQAYVKETEFRCRMYGARMEQLGGLLTFYAATKNAAKVVANQVIRSV